MPREVTGTGRSLAHRLYFWVWGFLLDTPPAPRSSTCSVARAQRLGNEACLESGSVPRATLILGQMNVVNLIHYEYEYGILVEITSNPESLDVFMALHYGFCSCFFIQTL